MNKSRCLVRCKAELQPERLCDVINKTKVLSAQQVVKNERGEEVRGLIGMMSILLLFLLIVMTNTFFNNNSNKVTLF